jgi:hypothetical protein
MKNFLKRNLERYFLEACKDHDKLNHHTYQCRNLMKEDLKDLSDHSSYQKYGKCPEANLKYHTGKEFSPGN